MQYIDLETGDVPASITRLVITQLIPATQYRFTVSALTESGPGPEVVVLQTTAPSNGGRCGHGNRGRCGHGNRGRCGHGNGGRCGHGAVA